MTERGFHPFAVLHFLRKTILLYLLPLLQVLFARNWAALRTALVQGAGGWMHREPCGCAGGWACGWTVA